jgi:hypothetical protein
VCRTTIAHEAIVNAALFEKTLGDRRLTKIDFMIMPYKVTQHSFTASVVHLSNNCGEVDQRDGGDRVKAADKRLWLLRRSIRRGLSAIETNLRTARRQLVPRPSASLLRGARTTVKAQRA